jgi:hypothetical protein
MPDDEFDPYRRAFLVTALNVALTQIYLRLGIKYQEGTKEEVLRPFINTKEDIQIYPGEGNIHKIMEYETSIKTGLVKEAVTPPISQYINFAMGKLSNRIVNENGTKLVPESIDSFKMNLTDIGTIYLGGPLANKSGGQLSGYDYSNPKFPRIHTDSKLRWHFLVGETDFGVYEAFDYQKQFAHRYENGILLKDRSLYSYVDKKLGNNPIFFKRDPDTNLLAQDVLIITKLISKETGKDQLIIGGMHGHSLEAFCRDLEANLNYITRKFGAGREWQLFIPFELIHGIEEGGKNFTSAKIIREQIIKESLSA